MTETAMFDWDDAYANGAHIPGASEFPPRWQLEAEAFRTGWTNRKLDIAYGDSERQRFDLFFPQGRSKGLAVFVHGGYWLKFDKSLWSHLAAGCLTGGWTVCMPSYDLAKHVRIADITAQIGSAISGACREVEGPVRLSGHSAGGHLVTRMLCETTPLQMSHLDRIEKVVSISGVHDLRPLRNTKMNDTFRLSEEDAASESPCLMKPARDCPVVAWVGEKERPEFIRQSNLLAQAWPNADVHVDPDLHHFDVIDGLKDAQSPLTSALIG